MNKKLATGAVALTGLLAVGLVVPQVSAFEDETEAERTSKVETEKVAVRDEDTPDVTLVDDEDDDDTTADTTFDTTADTTFDTVDTRDTVDTTFDTVDTTDDDTDDTFDTTDTRG